MLKKGNGGSKYERQKGLTRKLTVSAIFLALAIIVKVFATFMVPLFGANGMKIEFWGIFTTFPAILFGPLYGAVVGGLCDLFERDLIFKGLALSVYFEYIKTSLNIGIAYGDLSVESTRTEKCGVEYIGAVGRGNNYYRSA